MFSSEVLAEEGTFLNPTSADITCSRIKNRLTKIADLGIIFLRRKTHHPLVRIAVIIYSYYRRYAVPLFLGPTLYII